MTNKNFALELIKNSKVVAIYTHINTDCDAIGSSLALREALVQLGKTVDVFVHSEFPSNFEFYGDLSFYNLKSKNVYDLVVCLDTATEGRLGKYKFTYRKGVKNTLAIDHHHLSNELFCRYNYIKEASSTCEILYDILQSLNVKFTPTICKFLISGIITDTGKFMHSASSETFKVVGNLLALGNIKIEEISNSLINSLNMPTFNLLKRAYQNFEFYSENKVAILVLHHSEFLELGVPMENTNVINEIALQVKAVQVSILASEDDKGYFRVSFRSKGDVSAKSIAEAFGGGGHLNASGCKIFGEYDEVKQKLLDTTFETFGWKK